MNIKLFLALQVCLGSLLIGAPGDGQKVLSYLRRINDHLIIVVNTEDDSSKKEQHLVIAKSLIQQAIQNDNITDNASLYALGGMLFDDPIYAARAVELEKGKYPVRRTTVQLERSAQQVHDYGEEYLSHVCERIEEEEMMLMRPSLTKQERDRRKNILYNLEQTKLFVTAQTIAQGALQQAIYLYKQQKEEESNVLPK